MTEYKIQAMKTQMICILIFLELFGDIPLSDLVMRMCLEEVKYT